MQTFNPKESYSDQKAKHRTQNFSKKEDHNQRNRADLNMDGKFGNRRGGGDQRSLYFKQNFGYTEECYYYKNSNLDNNEGQRSLSLSHRGIYGVRVTNLPSRASNFFIRRFFENFGMIKEIKLFTENQRQGGTRAGGPGYGGSGVRGRECYVYFFDEESVDRAVFNNGIRMLDTEVRIWVTREEEAVEVKDFDEGVIENPNLSQMGNVHSHYQGNRGVPYSPQSQKMVRSGDSRPQFDPSFRQNFEANSSWQEDPGYRREHQQQRRLSGNRHDQMQEFSEEGQAYYTRDRQQGASISKQDAQYALKSGSAGEEEPIAPKPRKPKKPFMKVERSPILYVGNLNYKTTNDQITEIFSQFGEIIDLRVAYNTSGSVSFFLEVIDFF